MQSIRIAAVSMNGRLGQPEEVLSDIDGWCAKAVDAGAELVAFPELVVHGHCTPNTWELAEAVPDGPATQRLCDFAKRHKLFLTVGLSEKDRDIVYNTQVFVGPEGYIGKQRKLHLSRDESLFYKGGHEFPVFDIGKCRVAAVICYDNQFPEIARVLALHGADVIFMPHAARIKLWEDTPESMAAARRYTHEQFAAYAMRARENACFAVVVDQAGRAGYVDNYPREHFNQPHHAGAAIVFDPDGHPLASTQQEEIRDEMIVCDLDASLLASARSHPNYTLRTRRPELFGELSEGQVSC